MTAFIARVEWHHADAVFTAMLLRDGQPCLNDALVGIGVTREEAVTSLTRVARHLVIHGSNVLTGGPVPDEDRRWLFAVLGEGCHPPDGELRVAADQLAPTGVTS